MIIILEVVKIADSTRPTPGHQLFLRRRPRDRMDCELDFGVTRPGLEGMCAQ